MTSKRTSIARGATGLPRYYMDVHWWTGPAWLGATPAEVGLRDAMSSYCARHSTEGRLPADPKALALALGFDSTDVRKPLKAILARRKPDGSPVLEVDGDQLVIPGYTDHNPTKAEVDAFQAERSLSARRGNHERWHTRRGVIDPACEFCPEDPGAPPDESPSDRNSDRCSDPPAIGWGVANASHGMGWDGIGKPSQSSSNTDAVGEPAPDDDDRPTLTEQAYAVIAARRADDHGGKTLGWRKAVAANLPTDEHHPGPNGPVTYETQAAWLQSSFVIDTPHQLADALTGRLETRNLTRRTDTRSA